MRGKHADSPDCTIESPGVFGSSVRSDCIAEVTNKFSQGLTIGIIIIHSI